MTKLALKHLGFFITPGKLVYGKPCKGYTYKGTLYGDGIKVYKNGECHPANADELKMYKKLMKLLKDLK